MKRNVLEMGGSAKILEILGRGPVRALRNWPGALAEIRAGNVDARPIREAGVDRGEERWYEYTLSPRGRRRAASHRGTFA